MNAPDLDAVLDSLTHLICGECDFTPKHDDPDAPSSAQQKWHKLSPLMFDGFELMDISDQDDFILFGNSVLDQPIWPLDVCSGFPTIPGIGWDEGSWSFNRIRTLRPREWRGKIAKIYPKMVEVLFLGAAPNGRQLSVRTPYGLNRNGAFRLKVNLDSPRPYGYGEYRSTVDPSWFGGEAREDQDEIDRVNNTIRLSAGMALRRYYLWSVLIGEGTGARARFVTDPTGVREAFRLRDIPPGAARRKALLHWVGSHWRKRRDVSLQDKAWIREHLRGQWTYTWNGLRCQIEPSIHDLNRLTTAAA